MRRTRIVSLILLLTLAVLSGACAKKADEDPVSVNGFDTEGDLGGSLDGKIAPGTGLGGKKGQPSSNEVVQAALEDVESFWDREYSDLYGGDYTPISGDFWAYGPDTEQPPCGDPAPSYTDIADNAFYCPESDLIAWDNAELVPNLYEQYGGFTLGIVFAHEFGHAIQDSRRAGITGPTILTELQADCFAGAWTKDVAEGNSKYFEVGLDDLDKAIAGFLDLRDSVGTDPSEAQAHGTAFDRIGSFTEGFQQGLGRCADYPSLLENGELVVVESEFTDPQDYARGGNMDLSDPENVQAIINDLQNFWDVAFTDLGGQPFQRVADIHPYDPSAEEIGCGDDTYTEEQLTDTAFYCVPDNTVYLDTALLDALNRVGDYAVVTEFALQWAFAAQVQLGDTENSTASNLKADCYAGVFAYSGFSGNRADLGGALTLSPGDLDEAVIAFLLTSDTGADVEAGSSDVSVGTAFQRFDAYRTGFIEGIQGIGPGISACDQHADANS